MGGLVLQSSYVVIKEIIMKRTILPIFVLSLITYATINNHVHAEESVSILLVSKHVVAPNCKLYGTKDDPCEFNERNFGLSYAFDITDKVYSTFGAYHNSFYRLSTHIGIGYRLKYAGIAVSAITGYPMAPVLPGITPYFEVPVTKNTRAQLLMPFMPDSVQVLALQVKVVL